MVQQQYTQTSFLYGLVSLLEMFPEQWRQRIFDTYVYGGKPKVLTRYKTGLREIANRYRIHFDESK